MTITKKFDQDDDRVNIIDYDTGVMFTVIKIPGEGYVIDGWTNQGSDQNNEEADNFYSVCISEEEYTSDKTDDDIE